MERLPSDLSTSSVRAKTAARGVDSCMDELDVCGVEDVKDGPPC